MSRTKIDWDDYWAKHSKGTPTGSISSKKPMSAVEFLDLATETAEFTKNQEKARKNAVKATNDAELARRKLLYPHVNYLKSSKSLPDPNAVFARKKLKRHLRGSPKTAALPGVPYEAHIETKDGIFILSHRYAALYKDLRANGNSVEYSVDYIKAEMKQDKHFQQLEDEAVEEWGEADEIADEINVEWSEADEDQWVEENDF